MVFLHFFEEDENKQEIQLSGSMIEKFPADVEAFVVQVLKGKAYVANEEACKYCTYADICMASVQGETL